MKILKINSNRPEKKLIKFATSVLKKDGLVVFPTDTLYGLGANALSKKAIIKVYKAKGRNYRKPLSVAFHSVTQAKRYVNFNSIAMRLAQKFLPGPLTLILPMKYRFSKELTSGSRNVGVRIPDNKIALKLIKECGYPITATSANISGHKEPVTVKDAINQIGDKVDLILDSGRCKYCKPSTVIVLSSGKIEVIREGVISKGELLKI